MFLLLVLCSAVSSSAADLNGAWAEDTSVCGSVFVKRNNGVSFAPNAELYGSGLIIEGNRVTGTFQKCTIKSRKDDGNNIHLFAACTTGVMVSETQFIVKFAGDDRITLRSAGSVESEVPMVRCSM